MFSSMTKALALGTALALASTAAAFAQVSFLDHRGKLIEFATPPERMAAVIGSGGVLLYRAIDGTSAHIAGTNPQAKTRFEAGIYGTLMPELLDLNTGLGNEFVPNVEALLEVKPDAVLQWIFDPEIIEPMERVGLKVVGWDCCTEQNRRDYMSMTGYMTGHIDRAQMMLKMEDDSNAALREKFSAIPAEEYTTLLEVDQIDDQIRVIANSSRDYTLSAIDNLAADGTNEWWRTIDAEQFLSWNPDIIVISGWQQTIQPSDIYDHPLLGSVEAVKNRRVYRIPMFNSNPDAPEIHLTAQWLARIASPEKFEQGFRETVRGTYEAIYGRQPTDAQLDIIFEIEANSKSAGYAELFGG
jgi:iron complex transport system substrate-binding protein